MEIDLLHFFLPNIFVLQLLMLCKRMNAICLWSINLAGDRNARVKSIRLVIVTKYGVSTRNAYRSDHINTNRSITIYSSSTTEFNVNGETIGQPIKPTHRHTQIHSRSSFIDQKSMNVSISRTNNPNHISHANCKNNKNKSSSE